MTKVVIARSNGTTRPRAMTATQVSTNFRSYTPKAKHGRAASELTTSSRVTHSEPLAGALPVISFKRDASATVSDDSINHFSGEQDFDATWRYIQSSESVNRDAKYGDDLQEATTTILQPFFDIKSEYPEDLNGEQIKGTIDRVDYSVDKNASPAGHTFDELVDRLLSQQMSKADSKFVAAFLCLYRKFAAPAELLATIFRRFEALNQNDEPMLLRISSQLRHLTILAQWVSEYPGDFAHPLTHQQMTEFIKQNAGNRLFAAAASEMSAQLEVVTEDDDTQWACSDKSRGRASTLESFSSVPSMRSSIAAMIADKSLHDNSSLSIKSQDGVKDRLTRHSKTPSSASSLDRSTSLSGSSMLTVMNSVEAAQRQAELLTPITRTPLTKVQWHYFMEFGDEEVAREMTRIDWIMYSSIRPRDLIRHVSLPVDQKQKCKSLEHVNRMIDQFNHVAFWVANMILLRDKPKHRAKALEKFMGIAWVSTLMLLLGLVTDKD